MNIKKITAEKAVECVEDGMTIGLGSGSTASYAIGKLGERVREGLKIKAVASSRKSEELALALSIPVFDPSHIDGIDLAIDGADEVDKQGNLIKGGGGSLLREKIIACASKRFHVVIDSSKRVDQLGKFPLAVEVLPFGAALTLKHLMDIPCSPALRQENGKNMVTDNGNFIADCRFAVINDPAWLDVKLKMIPGVVETGLFPAKMVTSIFTGYENGDVSEVFINP